jgi:hypothetical protein
VTAAIRGGAVRWSPAGAGAELAAQLKVLALGDGERSLQPLGFGTVALFEFSDLRGERAHNVDRRGRLICFGRG